MNEELRPQESQESQEAQEPQEAAAAEVSPQELALAMQALKAEQRLVPGSIAGLIASLLGAGVWAAVTVLTEYQIGWMAVGIGFLVGLTIRHTGHGIDPVFGIVAALQSLFGCAVGNILTISYFVARSEGLPFVDVLLELDTEVMVSMLVATFEVMDLLFYGLAAYFGYRYAFREVTPDDVKRALGKAF